MHHERDGGAAGGGGGGRNTARQAMDGLWTEVCGQQKQSNDPRNNQHNPRYANYWAPLTRTRHIPPHSAQSQHANHWAPRTRKRHQQEHRPQRPTERSDPTQHAKGRTGDRPGPHKEATTRRNVTRGGGGARGTPTPQGPRPDGKAVAPRWPRGCRAVFSCIFFNKYFIHFSLQRLPSHWPRSPAKRRMSPS